MADSGPYCSRVATTLALVAAFLFALAATLQQKGALNLPTISLADPMSLVRLAGQTTWLIGTLALFTGYLFQAGALDRGRLSIIQPLLVTTVVFALPLGYFMTRQHVGRREVIGAVAIIIGLGLFVAFGDPAGGKENASNSEWAIAIGLLSVLSVLILVFGSGGSLSMKAAVYGTVAGVLFGLSSALTKPTLNYLHESVGTMLSHWECYALAVAGVLGFVLQQVSLGTGRLAPSVATVSVANPLVGSESGSSCSTSVSAARAGISWSQWSASASRSSAPLSSRSRVGPPVNRKPPRTRRTGLSPRRS